MKLFVLFLCCLVFCVGSEKNEDVELVHLVFMTHLDVGFTNFARNVCELYFYHHFPAAIQTAETLKQRGGQEQFVYTSHPWLLLEYLDGAAGCTPLKRTPEEIELLENAIANGYITWHAKPWNELCEVLDPSLFTFGLTLSEELDLRFNKSKKIAASSKDVPGVSRSTVPLLAGQGILGLHIGANPACTPPAVPQAFIWNSGDSELLTLFHYGWPLYGGDIIIPGFSEALVYNFTLDNSSPLTADDVIQFYAIVQEQFPNAKIVASSLDAFVESLWQQKQILPVLTEEMGNTWAYGIGADPFRTSTFREILRLRSKWIEEGKMDPFHPQFKNFNRRLMKIPEHNWGLSDWQYLNSTEYSKIWSNSDFQIYRNDPDFTRLAEGWAEARSYLFNYSLPFELQSELDISLENLKPKKTNKEKFQQIPKENWGKPFDTSQFIIAFNQSTGAMNYLVVKASGKKFASREFEIVHFLYQTFSMSDFDHFNEQYNPGCGPPCGDFSKVGMEIANPQNMTWEPTLIAIFANENEFLLELQLPEEASIKYGAPTQVIVEITCSLEIPEFELVLKWFGKPATRLAEAMWLSFNPDHSVVSDTKGWSLDVMGSAVNPYDVVANGSRHLHAIWSGVTYSDSQGNQMNITSLDCPLVAPGDINHLLNFDGDNQPACENGMHFNLFNNLWGTAFNQWYDNDALFRFVLNFK